MLDIKYYKDYRHNYLILKDNGSLSENIYQRKMVTENKIRGLLESRERHINGDMLLYYEITSRQSLASIYDGKSMGMEQLCNFFTQLKKVNEYLQKYLLDGSCLILQPEYIFQDIESGEYYFLYYPDPEEGKFAQLLDFLMTIVNNEDMEAVEMVYKMADLTGKEQFVLDEILRWFQDDIVNSREKAGTEQEYREKEMTDKALIMQNESADIDDENRADLSEIQDGEDEKDKRKAIMKICLAWGLWILGSGILIYLKSNYILSRQENIYLLAVGITITVLAVIFSLMTIYRERDETKEKENGQIISKQAYRSVDISEYKMSEPPVDLGNTVFIPWTENCENKLYSIDRKNKYHIDLGRLPVTVGKLAGAVDMVIKEQSISRMHAKFSRAGNNIFITDLNSTNGTFKNGLRLTPNTSEMIEPGDEIRLGKLKFIYR